MKNSFLNRFTPKEPKFFPLLKSLSSVLLSASDLLIECVQVSSHAEVVEYYKKIKEQEREGDRLSDKIFEELNTTFITPFDREDINHLANRLDDVIDGINSSVKRMVLYSPKSIPEDALKLAEQIKEGAVYVDKAVDELNTLKKNAKNIKNCCRELHNIENRADDVYEHFVIRLFSEERDGIEIIKLKEIMYELEKTTNTLEAVGKIIKTIIVKYA